MRLPGVPLASNEVEYEGLLQPGLLQGRDQRLLCPDLQLWLLLLGIFVLQLFQEHLNFFLQFWTGFRKCLGQNHPDAFPVIVSDINVAALLDQDLHEVDLRSPAICGSLFGDDV